MHELALAQQLLHIIKQAAGDNNLKKVTIVKIILGEMMAVVPEALEFSFQVLSRDTVAEGAKLVLEKQQALSQCSQCGYIYSWLEHGYRCTSCYNFGGTIIQGRDLYIDYLEGDENQSGES